MAPGQAIDITGPDGDERPAEFVEALAKGIGILESFDVTHPEMTLSEIARRVGLSPAAARRSLITLQALGYVGQVGRRFHLRPKILTLGFTLFFSAGIGEVLQPDLRELVEQFGDASSIGMLEGEDVIYIAHSSVQRARRATATIGARYPAYATSLGRVLLAGLGDAALDAYLGKVKPEDLTAKTVTDVSALRQIILAVRRDGYSTTVDQLDYGITALGVAIRGPDGRTIAALNSSGDTGMVTPEKLIDERLPTLLATASRIGNAITRYPILQSVMGQ
ncbi:MAG: helix-turn-helix domain-containing protein [Candidatus Devosia euplotis]|nr:helix-turn-helix domain-containing protein [Candidatus Devosia euplotis]